MSGYRIQHPKDIVERASQKWAFAELGKNEWAVFRVLARELGGTAKDRWTLDRHLVATEIGIHPDNVSKAIGRLVDLGIVSRVIEQPTHDKKISRVGLSYLGEAYCGMLGSPKEGRKKYNTPSKTNTPVQ